MKALQTLVGKRILSIYPLPHEESNTGQNGHWDDGFIIWFDDGTNLTVHETSQSGQIETHVEET